MSEATGRRGGTRDDIIAAAMSQFAQDGYDKTSLREIAEAVGVTKAALYYHFRTKADIVQSALREYTDALTDLIDRAERRPAGRERNAAIVDELAHLFSASGGAALRFVQANPTVMSQLDIGDIHVTQLKRLAGALTADHPSAENTIRATLAFAGLVIGTVGGALEPPGEPEERLEAARAVALDLLTPLV